MYPNQPLAKYWLSERAREHARNEFIVYCDDDNWLAPDYLIVAKEIFLDPKVGGASGQAEPVFEGDTPTFVYSHGNWLALGIQALNTGDVTNSVGYLWGAGMVARRTDLMKIFECPYLPILSGPSGVLSIARGDDNELCWAIAVLGKRLIYDERLKIKHFMPRERLNMAYLRNGRRDYYLDGAFERVADAYRDNPNVDLWHGRCRIVDQFGAKVDERIGSIKRYDEILDLWDVWWKRRNFVQPEVFWTKRIGKKVGAFREDLTFGNGLRVLAADICRRRNRWIY